MNDSTTNIPQRQCSKCGNYYPATLEFFYSQTGGRYGLSSTCKSCQRTYAIQWNKNHPEQVRDRNAKWSREHAEVKNIRAKEYAKKHPEKVNKTHREWGRKNKDKKRLYAKRDREKHPDNYRAKDARRRAIKHNAPGSYNAKTISSLLSKQDSRCIYCGMGLQQDYHVDHFVPLCHGGTNYTTNLVISCESCNTSKGGRLYEEWKASRGW